MANSVFLSKNLVSTTNNDLKQKNRHVERVNNVDWYFYLVPQETQISLTDDFELKDKLVVCWNIPKGKDIIRLFAAFQNQEDFLNYLFQIEASKWCFFEVILGEQAQKIYFDIDIHVNELKGDVDIYCTGLLSALVDNIDTVLQEYGLLIDIAKQILIFSSNSSTKRSYHLIVDGLKVESFKHNAVLCKEIFEELPSKYQDKRVIDASMYSSKQQLRFFGSQKPGSGRPKIHLKEWWYHDRLIACKHPALEDMRALFAASVVTHVDNCELIPVVVTESVHTFVDKCEGYAIDDELELSDDVIDKIRERTEPTLFQIFNIAEKMGPLILLRRKKPANCSLCARVHDHENAFLRVNTQGSVYFYCRRNEDQSKYVTSVADLFGKDIQSEHLKALESQPPIINSQEVSLGNLPCTPPSIDTIHQRTRAIAIGSNPMFKRR